MTLEAVGLAKSYSRRLVLRDVNLELRPGEMVGIVGENGAGKSTLLRILVGLSLPDRGRYRVRGRIGYCPQELLIFDHLTVRENLTYFAVAYGLADPAGAGSELLERLGFKEYEHTRAEHLSGGTRQKLNLTISLLHAPDVLILDEPYSGFDWETYLDFWKLADGLRAEGRSLLVVSHLIYERDRFDRIYQLNKGVLECL